jgi:hypothetical protein
MVKTPQAESMAVDAGMTAFRNSAAEVRTQNRTFTSKITNYVARYQGKVRTVEFAELIASLRAKSPIKKPVHAL